MALEENRDWEFPPVEGGRAQGYLEEVAHRYDRLDRLMESVREGNDYRALQVVRARNQSGMPGWLEDDLTERRFDLIQLKTLLLNCLRELGVDELRLDRLNAWYTRLAARMGGSADYARLSEELVADCCALARRKEFRNHSPLVQKIVREVDVDLGTPLTLAYFAEKLNVNRSYLSALFKREMGVTLTEYVTARRISRASGLLLTTQSPIKEVAEQVGIGDVHYFSRIFKEKTGQTPSEYRRSPHSPEPGAYPGSRQSPEPGECPRSPHSPEPGAYPGSRQSQAQR